MIGTFGQWKSRPKLQLEFSFIAKEKKQKCLMIKLEDSWNSIEVEVALYVWRKEHLFLSSRS